MTFTDSTYAVDGATITGQLYRLQLHSATYGGKGIVTPTDLEVRELSTPGSSVRILPGGCVIAGDAVAFLGSYFGYNVGDESVPIAATDSTGGRSDMIIVQAHDPNYSGSPFTEDPAIDRIVYPEVISNVSPSATTTSEVNAIPLARIDMPVSTATVTQDLITDLRRPLILNPYFQESIQHGGAAHTLGSQTDVFVDFPNSGVTFVDVPSWATRMDVNMQVMTARLRVVASPPGNEFGQCRTLVDGLASGGSSRWNAEWPGDTVSRTIIGHAATHDVSGLQGQRIELRSQASTSTGNGSVIEADDGTSTTFSVFFRQEPEFNITA